MPGATHSSHRPSVTLRLVRTREGDDLSFRLMARNAGKTPISVVSVLQFRIQAFFEIRNPKTRKLLEGRSAWAVRGMPDGYDARNFDRIVLEPGSEKEIELLNLEWIPEEKGYLVMANDRSWPTASFRRGQTFEIRGLHKPIPDVASAYAKFFTDVLFDEEAETDWITVSLKE